MTCKVAPRLVSDKNNAVAVSGSVVIVLLPVLRLSTSDPSSILLSEAGYGVSVELALIVVLRAADPGEMSKGDVKDVKDVVSLVLVLLLLLEV